MHNPPQPEQITGQQANEMAELFRALSDPTRIRIIGLLLHGEINVGSLAKNVGVSESAVSHQMRTLRQMRLVQAHKRGREVYYCLDDEHIADLFRRSLEHISHD